MQLLFQKFNEILSRFSDDESLIVELWQEIEKNYTSKGRYYHNLQHLDSIFHELNAVENEINDSEVLALSVFYHDVIYQSTAKDNEEKSAKLAIQRLKEIGFNSEKINKISKQIIATKSHQISDDLDTNFLLDADLSILGKNWDDYEIYIRQIRKEYSIYPDFLYKPGRKKVLEHFLTFPQIFKTEFFIEKYEAQARYNLRREIELL